MPLINSRCNLQNRFPSKVGDSEGFIYTLILAYFKQWVRTKAPNWTSKVKILVPISTNFPKSNGGRLGFGLI